MAEIKREIRGVIADVLSGRLERGVGAVAFQGFNALLKAVEVERKVREQEEVEERIAALEAQADAAAGGGRRWGA